MSLGVFAVILFAAALHATWNAIVKGGGDKLMMTTLVSTWAAGLAAAGLPFVRAPDPASWPFLAVSTGLQLGYLLLVARTYSVADMSQAYPLMRGSAPLIVALASSTFLGERVSNLAWLGVAAICAGVLALAGAGHKRRSRRGVILALINAAVIASYTLVDGFGVRHANAPAGYALWLFVLTGAAIFAWVAIRQGGDFARYAPRNWLPGLIGGAGTLTSYSLALWAMTSAPIAVVAALRETSILFGAAISATMLKERLGWARLSAAFVIAVGAMVLRLA